MSRSQGPSLKRSTEVDWVVIGAGIFGLFAALVLRRRGATVAVIDLEPRPLLRSSLVNQARVHNGYHYPRSVFTALRSAGHSKRFAEDFSDAVSKNFRQIYAVSRYSSYTDAEGYDRFCSQLGLPLRRVDPRPWLQDHAVEAAWETVEYTFDASRVRTILLERIERLGGVDWRMQRGVAEANISDGRYDLRLTDGSRLQATGVVNATYAGCNSILQTFGFEGLSLKYELAELMLVNVSPILSDAGITMMDGPFFSLTPFGLTGTHSLTAVDYTPRLTSTAALPTFPCQQDNPTCLPARLANCANCSARPRDSWPSMRQLTKVYLDDDITLTYRESLFAVKTVLATTEVDDSRPTLLITHRTKPAFLSVLSGKISTIYDLEYVL